MGRGGWWGGGREGGGGGVVGVHRGWIGGGWREDKREASSPCKTSVNETSRNAAFKSSGWVSQFTSDGTTSLLEHIPARLLKLSPGQ